MIRLTRQECDTLIMTASIHVRAATMDDAELLRAWRNDASVRRASRKEEPVGVSEHLRWLENCIRDSSRVLLIGEDPVTGEPVGMVRFDEQHDDTRRLFEVSILVASDCRGKGLARSLLLAGESDLAVASRGARVVAFVKSGNDPSIRLFEACGYVPYPPITAGGRWFAKDLR